MQRSGFAYISLFAVLALLVSVGGAVASPPGPPNSAAKLGSGAGAPPGPEVPLVCTPLLNVVQDSSFEAGSPNPYWQEYARNFRPPLCTVGTCGDGGGTAGPHIGSWWAWFGGSVPPETTALTQTVSIPSGIAVLQYWLWIGAAQGSVQDFLDVMIDSTVVAHYDPASQPQFPAYTPVQHDVSQFANGAQHVLHFESSTFGGITNFNVDDVELCTGAPTSVTLAEFESTASESAPAVPSPTWLLMLAVPAVIGGLILRRRLR